MKIVDDNFVIILQWKYRNMSHKNAVFLFGRLYLNYRWKHATISFTKYSVEEQKTNLLKLPGYFYFSQQITLRQKSKKFEKGKEQLEKTSVVRKI